MLRWKIIVFLCISIGYKKVFGWDNDELELFDLVEEINENFYTLLGIEETASAVDIRRAYRKLSLQLHPDKNKEADAEVKFRQLVAAYEVLKDDSKRAKYNDILVNGLPDWRQPVYYYRHVRKMGLIEMTILLTVILTVAHFLIVWSVYLEQRLEKEHMFRFKKKRDKKKAKQQGVEFDEDNALQAELDQIEKPKLSNILPCLIVRLVIHIIRSLPDLLKLAADKMKIAVQKQKVDEADDDDDEGDDNADAAIRRQKKKKINFTETLPSAYEVSGPSTQDEERKAQTNSSNSADLIKSAEEWTDADVELLAKAIIKFPGGTTERWEKIAQMVGRTVKEVTNKSKELKQTHSRTVDPSQQGITLSHLLNGPQPKFSLPNDLSKREHYVVQSNAHKMPDENDTVRRRSHHVPKTPDRTLMISSCPPIQKCQDNNTTDSMPPGSTGHSSALAVDQQHWTQMQQKLLESALVQFPRGCADRWDRVAELIPGKTKEDCIQRCKYLADVVKRKQVGLQPSGNADSAAS